MPKEAFLINPKIKRKRKPRRRVKVRRKRNPLNEGVLILGNRPRRRRRTTTRKRRRRTYRRNTPALAAVNAPRRRRRRVYRRKRRRYNPPALYTANAPARRRRRRRYNAPARRRRSYRRKPAMFKVSAISMRDPMSMVAPILTGITAKMAADRIPTMMGLTGYQRTLAQMGIGIGGGLMLNNIVGPIGATVWFAVSAAEALSDIVNRYLAQLTAGVSGMDQIGYPAGMGAYPGDFMGAGMGAYPDEVSGYPM